MRVFLALLVAASAADAATYTVGSGRQYPSLGAAFTAVDLEPGDIVEVYGNETYAGGIIMRDTDSGSRANPVVLRGIRVQGLRPVLLGGNNTIEFRQAQNVIFEGFEVVGATTPSPTFRCVYHYSDNLTIRDSLIRDCPRHGVLSADELSGDLTIEYTEIRHSGTSNDGEHSIYTTSDQWNFPNAVFRLRHSYIHSNNSGNLLKSRARRNEIYYNWFEGADVHELELIGPDPCCQNPGWSHELQREDSDVVGNVLVHSKNTHFAMVRIGGDGTGDPPTGDTDGRFRFVNNTLVWTATGVNLPVAWRTHFRLEAIEMHNNVVQRIGGTAFNLLREETPTMWRNGRRVAGSFNAVSAGATIPPEWTSTTTGAIVFVNPAQHNYQLAAGSVAIDAGTTSTSTSPNFNLDNPLFPPSFHPPQRIQLPPGNATPRPVVATIDIGAFEFGVGDNLFANGFE